MKRAAIERGVGCVLVVPAALIGFAALADGIGPRGWRGLSEFFGWAAVCLGISLALALLLAQVRHANLRSVAAVAGVIASTIAFAYFAHWLGLYAPMVAKRAFTSTLQVVGTVAAAAFVLSILYFAWRGQQRY